MAVTINGDTGVTTPGISNSEGYTGDGLTIAAGAPSGAVAVDSSGNVGIGTSSPTNKLDVRKDDTSPSLIVGRVNLTGSLNDFIQGLSFVNGANASYNAQIYAYQATSFPDALGLGFITQSGSGNRGTRMVIDSDGNLLVGTTSALSAVSGALMVKGVTNPAYFQVTSNGGSIVFRNASNVTSGTITINASTVAYNTSSDYRLKENIQPMTGALAKVAALKPCTYKWKADGSDGEGFIAHELAEVVPQCVTGEKDAIDAEGKPVYQGIDTSFLVATLTAAIQELKAQVDAQAVEIAALKGQA